MEQKKVQLPREVAEAIWNLSENYDPSHILWRSSRPECEKGSDDWRTLYDFANITGNNFILADALRYGYEPEPEPITPITVTITPEQLVEIREYRDRKRLASPQIDVVDDLLDILGIKIQGVNE